VTSFASANGTADPHAA